MDTSNLDKKDTSQKIYIASDHAGFDMKNNLVEFLTKEGYRVEDMGPNEYNEDDDYPDFAIPLAKKVSVEAKDGAKGILLCGNGQGMCIAANKVKGIRAATATFPEMAYTTRSDDDANILCLPARCLNEATSREDSREIARVWLETLFSGAERHKRRISKVMALD